MKSIFTHLKEGKIEYLSYRQLEQLRTFVEDCSTEQERDYFIYNFIHRIDPDEERTNYECFMKQTYSQYLEKRKKYLAKRKETTSIPEEEEYDFIRLSLTPQLQEALDAIRRHLPSYIREDNHNVIKFALGYALGALEKEKKVGKR